MLTNLEIYRRASTGEICQEKDFDLKRFIPAVRSLVKKYGIKYEPDNVVPSDDDLADRVWQAGRELFLQTGVFCVDTERIIRFDPIELDQALAHAPRDVVVGFGEHARHIPVRRPESGVTPFFSLGACGGPVSDDQVFMSLTQAYAELPYTDAVASPSMTQVDGLPVIAGSPLEIEGCVRTVRMTREATRRANRYGMGIANTVATGVRSQGHIVGNAVAADQCDMMEIGHTADLKTDYDGMSKITYMQGQGRPILGGTGIVLGGYAGGPEGAAILFCAYHFFALLVQRACVLHPYITHIRFRGIAARDVTWARSVGVQACVRHSDVPILETGGFCGGAATLTGMYEAASVSAVCTASGGSLEAGPTALGTQVDRLSPMEPLFAAEVGRAVVGMTRKDVNDLVLKLLDKYESSLENPPLGQRYQECFDVASRQPRSETLDVYKRARADLIEMGLEFKDPPFYA